MKSIDLQIRRQLELKNCFNDTKNMHIMQFTFLKKVRRIYGALGNNGAINSIANNIYFLFFFFYAVPEFNVIKHINAISSQNI